jgi:hypothetical protein
MTAMMAEIAMTAETAALLIQSQVRLGRFAAGGRRGVSVTRI